MDRSRRNQIFLIAVLRYSDKTVCACYSSGHDVDKEGVREQVASNAHARPGGKYTATGDLQSIHYCLDHMGRIYSIVTNPSFSVRTAFIILEEFQQSFQRDFGSRLSTASEESLSRVSTPMLRDFCEKSESPVISDDKLNSIHEKLDVVRTTMQENIQQILLNQESVDRINSSAEHLTEQSIAFKSSTKELRNRMFWKMVKMRLLIFSVICALTAVIVAPIYFYTKK
mmetsp:Transcript_14390/g.23809  ORF Transcript_14390/g.23809 Transcript_14390/m.23809 type:complete len:227 (+) Transcript_14390:104-784(+)